MSQLSLSDTQKWMMSAIAFGGDLQNGLHAANKGFHLDEDEILVSDYGATNHIRLGIYAQGYWLRLLECLRADFPALRYIMGEELFDFFAKGYIWNHPSTSTTLFDLGAGFADFLQNTQSSKVYDSENIDPNLVLPLDIAKLERARVEVTRAKGLEKREMPFLDNPLAFLSEPNFKIETPQSLRLVSLSFPLIDFMQAIDRKHEKPIIPEFKPNLVAIARMGYRVTMSEIEPWQYSFLKAAQQISGAYDCAVKSSEETNNSLDEILAQLVVWFPLALSSGFLTID